jgi:hypothetical protein
MPNWGDGFLPLWAAERLKRCCLGFVAPLVVAVAASRPCIARAQGVDRGPHRLGLRLGVGPFFGGVDEDGHRKDKGSASSGTLDYGYLLHPHFEAGGMLSYWVTDTAVSDAFNIGGRIRGLVTPGPAEFGLELRAGYLGMLTPRVPDEDGRGYHDHRWQGFALATSLDAGIWISRDWALSCDASFTVGSGSDSSGIAGSYLPKRGGLVSLEGRCGARLAL